MASRRLQRLRARLAELNLDAMLITQAENRRYLSGFTGSAGVLIIGHEKQVLATDSRYWGQMAREAPLFELAQIKGKTEPTVLETLKALGARRVGFESGQVTVAQLEGWQKEFAAIELVPTQNVVESLRAVKDAQEIEVMRRASVLTDQAFDFLMDTIRPGMTEKQLAWDVEVFLRTHGAEGLAFEVHIASGPNSAEPHHPPTDRAVQEGEPIWIDMGARMDGYCSDLTRSFVIGKPDDQFKRIYNIVLQAQMDTERAMRAGLPGKEADAVARRVIEEAGFAENFGHGLGHGLGLAVHEKPSAGRLSDDTLMEGGVVTVEPGIYIPGWGGVRIEDVVIIEQGRAQVMTQAHKPQY